MFIWSALQIEYANATYLTYSTLQFDREKKNNKKTGNKTTRDINIYATNSPTI